MIHTFAGLPALAWTASTGVSAVDEDTGTLTLTAAPGVDWSNDPLGGARQHRAADLGFIAPAEFSLAARVSVDAPRTTFDAGALSLWADADHWAKLCFEYSPRGEAMVVSVVTNVHSDDCNAAIVTAPWTYLRVSRVGPAWAFHASSDGTGWDFIRLFRLHTDKPVRAGFLAQAPLGQECVARFDHIAFSGHAPANLRDGN